MHLLEKILALVPRNGIAVQPRAAARQETP
jgi:hypothetical protein